MCWKDTSWLTLKGTLCSLAARPEFTAVVVATLALGIGANSASSASSTRFCCVRRLRRLLPEPVQLDRPARASPKRCSALREGVEE